MVILLLLSESADDLELKATTALNPTVRLRRINTQLHAFVSWWRICGAMSPESGELNATKAPRPKGKPQADINLCVWVAKCTVDTWQNPPQSHQTVIKWN